ncbi:MAG TPA: NUDIX domain-containing protein [Candidatus Saccharimonas sp.]|nr:NUDIX domain-containing protein [Candidatus Saccharimonas sp.]
MKLWVKAIVHYTDGVLLVKDSKGGWKLPMREITDEEDVLLCIRRCVLLQTGYRAAKVRLFKMATRAKSAKKGALLGFIFGCEVNADYPLQAAEVESACFTPDEVLKLAQQKLFSDQIMLELILQYKSGMMPTYNDPLASFGF